MMGKESITVDVISATLPEQTLTVTQWFHCDCLAHYYDVDVWSEKHWRIIENFARVAHRNGINMLLTPVFTPPLDTQVGGERLTTQLVGVTVEGGKYTFDFSLLDRWVDMCDRIGIRYFEISHLFTQWGAKHAPKVMATVDGEYKKIFGWETDARSDEYVGFIRRFLAEFINHMKRAGNDKRCYFHISDEPTKDQLDSYCSATGSISDLLEGYVIMDALSDYSLYEQGVVSTPISNTNSIANFVNKGIPNLWVYYCCSQSYSVSNRFYTMPGYRARVLGAQMYRANSKGFLQWGYNFYYSRTSQYPINPYLMNDGDFAYPAGDAFCVYPHTDGTPLLSLHGVLFSQALLDLRAMKAAEDKVGREAVIAAVEAEGKIDYMHYPRSESYLLTLRDKVNRMAAGKE